MTLNDSLKLERFAELQQEFCQQFGCECVPSDPDSKVGFALDTQDRLPLNGLRHPPEGDTTGWYLWGAKRFLLRTTLFRHYMPSISFNTTPKY